MGSNQARAELREATAADVANPSNKNATKFALVVGQPQETNPVAHHTR